MEIKEVRRIKPGRLLELIETVLFTLGCTEMRCFKQVKADIYYIIVEGANFVISIQNGIAKNIYDIPDFLQDLPPCTNQFNYSDRKQYIWCSQEMWF